VIVDSSAIVAIATGEPDTDALMRAIAFAPSRRMSAATYVESGIVLDGRRDALLSRTLDELLSQLDITIAPVTDHQALIAREAYRDFGPGSGHPAQLNFGDCFSYALAKDSGEELLFKGDDFIHTDIRPAL
jgi:ribonuclease VapC